jgi:hypothetical protein
MGGDGDNVLDHAQWAEESAYTACCERFCLCQWGNGLPFHDVYFCPCLVSLRGRDEDGRAIDPFGDDEPVSAPHTHSLRPCVSGAQGRTHNGLMLRRGGT